MNVAKCDRWAHIFILSPRTSNFINIVSYIISVPLLSSKFDGTEWIQFTIFVAEKSVMLLEREIWRGLNVPIDFFFSVYLDVWCHWLVYVGWFGTVIDDDRVRMHFKASELTRGFRATLKTKRICMTSILASIKFKYHLNLQTLDQYDKEKNHWYRWDIASLSGG